MNDKRYFVFIKVYFQPANILNFPLNIYYIYDFLAFWKQKSTFLFYFFSRLILHKTKLIGIANKTPIGSDNNAIERTALI